MPTFTRYIGIDYSGRETPITSLRGLRVYLAEGDARSQKYRHRRAPANIGLGAASPNGWPRA
jgi:hypothetical protein